MWSRLVRAVAHAFALGRRRRARSGPQAPPPVRKPSVEALEDRTMPAIASPAS
jgi:hypothetical protein